MHMWFVFTFGADDRFGGVVGGASDIGDVIGGLLLIQCPAKVLVDDGCRVPRVAHKEDTVGRQVLSLFMVLGVVIVHVVRLDGAQFIEVPLDVLLEMLLLLMRLEVMRG